ncbi:hypothetical protein MPH_00609 [Macrophomina phaseolina MS6]|uniref:Uncharacterized protein n=1 Tax=Macrophomina phaseolina (strain MS6) TaxID=1126212 RepID=K2S549_MACPH|nr:hypothetical protein MPH_00609 [Macrophomina phaseolina MS6]
MALLTISDDPDTLISTSTETVHCRKETTSHKSHYGSVVGHQERRSTIPRSMSVLGPCSVRRRVDSISAVTDISSQFRTAACTCNCNCAGCLCSRGVNRGTTGLENDSGKFVLIGSGCSQEGYPQGEEGAGEYPPAFPWRDRIGGEHIDNLFGGFEMTEEGFQHSECDDCEPLRQSIILRDLASFKRTGDAASLINEATSGVASMTSSGFLPRTPEKAQNLLNFVGSWDETSPTSPGYHFTGQPLWLSPSNWSQRYESNQLGYPKMIRDEDMK